jgi:sterol desaturase/sphingolipid hydroxylase (fatty acid hydroxylase superfamily)
MPSTASRIGAPSSGRCTPCTIARVVTVTSSTRHFWFEEVVGVALGLPFGLAFSVPVEILIVAAPLRSIIIALAHTNVRAGYGFISVLITGPQYHRIRHSSRPEHIDKNFAGLFPLWDVIFGTVWRPKARRVSGDRVDEWRRAGRLRRSDHLACAAPRCARSQNRFCDGRAVAAG